MVYLKDAQDLKTFESHSWRDDNKKPTNLRVM